MDSCLLLAPEGPLSLCSHPLAQNKTRAVLPRKFNRDHNIRLRTNYKERGLLATGYRLSITVFNECVTVCPDILQRGVSRIGICIWMCSCSCVGHGYTFHGPHAMPPCGTCASSCCGSDSDSSACHWPRPNISMCWLVQLCYYSCHGCSHLLLLSDHSRHGINKGAEKHASRFKIAEVSGPGLPAIVSPRNAKQILLHWHVVLHEAPARHLARLVAQQPGELQEQVVPVAGPGVLVQVPLKQGGGGTRQGAALQAFRQLTEGIGACVSAQAPTRHVEERATQPANN